MMRKGLVREDLGQAPWFVQPRAESVTGELMVAAAGHRVRRGSTELCSV